MKEYKSLLDIITEAQNRAEARTNKIIKITKLIIFITIIIILITSISKFPSYSLSVVPYSEYEKLVYLQNETCFALNDAVSIAEYYRETLNNYALENGDLPFAKQLYTNNYCYYEKVKKDDRTIWFL